MQMSDENKAVTGIATPLAHKFQQLIDQGFVRPPSELPAQFSYPSVLVSVPSVLVTSVYSTLPVSRGVVDGELGNDSLGDRL
jgi:hypothetical protein